MIIFSRLFPRSVDGPIVHTIFVLLSLLDITYSVNDISYKIVILAFLHNSSLKEKTVPYYTPKIKLDRDHNFENSLF